MKKINLIITIAASSVLLWSCGSDEEKVSKKTAIKVTTEQVKTTEVAAEHRFSGKVTADNKMMLSTKIMGQIQQTLVKEGDKISKGQLLVTIKSNDLAAKRSTAVSGIKTAELHKSNMLKNYTRIKNLFDKGSATQRELEDMETAKEAAITKHSEAKQHLAEINDYLSYANLRSPINGFVSKKMVNVGDMAAPGQPILALESLDELNIEINVPEFEIGQFELENKVSLTVDAAKFNSNGTVARIVPSTSFSGQYKVVIALAKNNAKLKPGMFAKVNLLKDTEMKLLIPSNLIIKNGQLTGLYTVNQLGEAMLRWVRLGKEYGDKVEVISGLIAGEQLITSSTSKLTDGILVKSSK